MAEPKSQVNSRLAADRRLMQNRHRFVPEAELYDTYLEPRDWAALALDSQVSGPSTPASR